MREYSKVSPQFWIGKTGKELRAAGVEAQIVSFYLMTCSHANMIGLYYIPKMFISHETGLTMQGALKGLTRSIEALFCSYDDQTEMVFVHEMASYQIGESLEKSDKRCKGIQKIYDESPDNPFLSAFYDKYEKQFHLTKKREISTTNIRPLQAPSKPLRSQEQEQEQEQEENIHSQPPKNLGKTKSTPRPRNLFWDSMVAVWGNPVTGAEKSRFGKNAAEFANAEIDPAEIPLRYARVIKSWKTLPCSPEALLKHWSEFGSPNGNGNGSTLEDAEELKAKRLLDADLKQTRDHLENQARLRKQRDEEMKCNQT